MEALNIVNAIITEKLIASVAEPRKGPPGHGLLVVLRLLLYALFQEIFSTRHLLKHLAKRAFVWQCLGFKSSPSKRSVDRWKKKHDIIITRIVEIVGRDYQQLLHSEWTILDSTPIPDNEDPEGKWGYTSRGPFFGFKLHASCDEYQVPLRAVFTTGNVYDSTQAEKILTPTERVGGDAAYDTQEIKKACRAQGSKPYFVHNPRRKGKAAKKKTPKLLKKVRVCVEQMNGFLKEHVLHYCWTRVKGFAAKATLVLLSVLATQALAIWNFKKFGYPSIRISEVRC
ncbi:MAG: transposase [Nanoarchaeota archaeon]